MLSMLSFFLVCHRSLSLGNILTIMLFLHTMDYLFFTNHNLGILITCQPAGNITDLQNPESSLRPFLVPPIRGCVPWEADSEMGIFKQEVYCGECFQNQYFWWNKGSRIKKSEHWAEWNSHGKVFSQSHLKLWSQVGPSEQSEIGQRGWVFVPLYWPVIGYRLNPGNGQNLCKATLSSWEKVPEMDSMEDHEMQKLQEWGNDGFRLSQSFWRYPMGSTT